MSRVAEVPSFNDGDNFNKSVDEIFSSIETIGTIYESGFLTVLMSYIKEDERLKNFYIRFVYECEVAKKVMNKDNSRSADFYMLEMQLSNMKNASTIEAMAMADSSFHQTLFYMADEEKFFEWFYLNSQELQVFLGNFWNSVGLNTKYHEELIEIHQMIFDSIKNCNVSETVEAFQRHFSILLLQLLGIMYKD